MNEPATALVSGANRGIGREIARRLAEEHGFLVFAGARDPGQVRERGTIVAVQLDVTSDRSTDAARRRVESDAGRLDVLVNNAGIYGDYAGAAEYDLGTAHEVIETNLFGAWRLTQAFLPLLRRSRSGRIVNVSSDLGRLSEMGGGAAAYRVSKAALNALTRVVAGDERGSGVLVNAVAPGWTRTDMGGSGAPRSVAEAADTVTWLATTDDDPPSGGYFRDRQPTAW